MPIRLSITDLSGQTKGSKLDFAKDVIRLGRDPANEVPLSSPEVSRMHARIVKQGEDYYLMDTESKNGTFLNKGKLTEHAKKLLRNADVIGIGKYQITFLTEVVPSSQDANELTDPFVRRKFVDSIANLSEGANLPCLILCGGPEHGRKIKMAEDSLEITVGRGEDCDIVIDRTMVSKNHARIVKERNVVTIYDLNSTNGTFVNGKKIVGRHELKDRDEILLGRPGSQDNITLIYSHPDEISEKPADEPATTPPVEAEIRPAPPSSSLEPTPEKPKPESKSPDCQPLSPLIKDDQENKEKTRFGSFTWLEISLIIIGGAIFISAVAILMGLISS